MAKLSFKKSTKPAKSTKSAKLIKESKRPARLKGFLKQHRRQDKVRLHKSFKRSYKEDYARDIKLPGLLSHSIRTFQIIFQNWKLFLPLLLIIVIFNIVLVGLMSESTYVQFQDTLDETNEQLASGELGNFAKSGLLLIATVTTGGLTQGMTEVQQVFAVILFLVVWLVTIYLIRHILSGHKPKLRDGLYNALAPLISTMAVFGVIFLECIPIMIVIVTYSAAVTTEFLATPFYALIYFIFAALLLILSTYLLASSLLALVAVTAPGLYPIVALNTATDLIAGRRTRFIIRIIYLIFVLAIVWVVVMMPIILLDLWLKSIFDWMTGFPIVPFALLCMTVFSFIYLSAYFYLFYRRMLDYDD